VIDAHAEGIAFDLLHYLNGLDLRTVLRDLCSDTPSQDMTPEYLNLLIGTLPDVGMFRASVIATELGLTVEEVRGWGTDRQIAVHTSDASIAALSFANKKDRKEAFFPRPSNRKRRAPMTLRSILPFQRTPTPPKE